MGTWLVHMKSHYAEGQEAPRAVGAANTPGLWALCAHPWHVFWILLS